MSAKAESSGRAAGSERKRRSELLQYYDGGVQKTTPVTFDLNSTEFNAKMYADKLIRDCNLKQLLEEEAKLASTAHSLDSDCQTLVYEHYDKFLHATDLVHKLKEGSSEMENQLNQLETNMALITESSTAITSGLKERREELSKLIEVHNTLHKLEFLYQLPTKMEESIKQGKMEEAVECYMSTKDLLQRYTHLSSLSAVQKDSDAALCNLKQALHSSIADGSSSRQLASCVELLLQLGEPRASLQDSFLKQAQQKLAADLETLRGLTVPHAANKQVRRGNSNSSVQDSIFEIDEMIAEVERMSADTEDIPSGDVDPNISQPPQLKFSHDLLEFISKCHDTHGADLWLLISSYQEMFLSNLEQRNNDDVKKEFLEASVKLKNLVESSVKELLSVVALRIKEEVLLSPLHTSIMATALDKLHRRLKALETMMKDRQYTQWSIDLILKATELQCDQALNALKDTLENILVDVRHGIASDGEMSAELPSLLSHLVASTAAAIKQKLSLLIVFLSAQCSFSAEETFRVNFILHQAREKTVVAFLKHLSNTLCQFAGGLPATTGSTTCTNTSSSLLLVLARAAWDLQTSTAHYLLRECDDSLGVLKLKSESGNASNMDVLTSTEVITNQLRDAAQQLLDAYVSRQGSALSQLLVRSVELKDWLNCGEPRTVRRVMRTVKEDIEAAEIQVQSLYEEGQRKERSSDSSRRTFHSSVMGSHHHRPGHSGGIAASLSGAPPRVNLSKLWCDRIEIFSPVSPEKLSIMTGIVKIALKSLEECMRLRTLGRFGLQQVQVDVHYLRTHLWRHVSDDSLLTVMLDEIITAAALRCNDPLMMEHSVVEFICEQ